MSQQAIPLGDALRGSIQDYGFQNPLALLLLIPLLLALIFFVRRGGLTKYKLGFMLTRALILALLVLAVASPQYFQSRKVVEELPPITVLADQSASMKLYPEATALAYSIHDRLKALSENLTDEPSRMRVELFSQGNQTRLGDAIYHNLIQYGGQPSTIILVSDGLNNMGKNAVDIAEIAGKANGTIYAVRPVKRADDTFIQAVLGEKKIPTNIDYDLLIRVVKTGDAVRTYELKVFVNDVLRLERRVTQDRRELDIPFSMRIRDIGVHQIRVEIDPPNDMFPENNVYYKVVEVVEKPRLLFVSGNSTSPFLKVLEELYEVEVTGRVPNDYGAFAGVIFDNIHSREFTRERVNNIKQYILEGNGAAFIGGRNSFEYGEYNNSFIENILPVTSVEKPTERRKNFAIAFLIDISQSTGYGEGPDSKINVEKALALGMLRALDANDTVSVIAFNNMPHILSQPSPLGPKYDELEDKILRLKFSGGTDMIYSLDTAKAMLKQSAQNKYLIILSDGVIQRSRHQLTLNKISELEDEGVRTFTVGVGFDTDENFMQELAKAGAGQYFSVASDPEKRLKMVFGDEADEKDEDLTPVVRRDEYHYITRNLINLEDAQTSVAGHNKVQEKNVAQLLLSTKGGQPILTAWHFGLGRVAALTTDNGLQWGQSLMAVDNSRLVSGLTNWIIGDLEKGQAIRANSAGTHLGGQASISVISADAPSLEVVHTASRANANAALTRTGLTSYSASFTPEKTGFYAIRARAAAGQDLDALAVNYPAEYLNLGVNDNLLRRITQASNGLYVDAASVDDMIEEIMERARESSTKEVKDTLDLWPYLIAAAILIYFADAAIRRLHKLIKREKTVETL
jgi:Mg-chelatase subunit ChlD